MSLVGNKKNLQKKKTENKENIFKPICFSSSFGVAQDQRLSKQW